MTKGRIYIKSKLTQRLIFNKFFKKRTTPIKQSVLNGTIDMLHKIETIEKEIVDLKLTVLRKLTPTGKKVISLKGIFKGVDITDEDVTSAKKSLYSKIGI